MPIPVVPKSSEDPAVAPSQQGLQKAELALNSGNGILYAKMADGTVLPVRARGLPVGEDGTASGRDRGTFDGGCEDCQTDDNGTVLPPDSPPPTDGPTPPDVVTTEAVCQQLAVAGQGALRVSWTLGDAAGRTPVSGFLVQERLVPIAGGNSVWGTAVGAPASQRTAMVFCDYVLSDENDVVIWNDSPGVSQAYTRTGEWRVIALSSAGRGRSVASQQAANFPGQCCSVYPPDPLMYECVDIGPKSGYRCSNGQCVEFPSGREYAVVPRIGYPNGVTGFATEAQAAAYCATLDGAVFTDYASCASECNPPPPPPAGAWRCNLGQQTRYACPDCTAGTAPVLLGATFVPGASVGGGEYYATEAAAIAACGLLLPDSYATQAACVQACPPQKYKCVTTTNNGQQTRSCVAVPAADVANELANGSRMFSSASACQSRCIQDAACTGRSGYALFGVMTGSWFSGPYSDSQWQERLQQAQALAQQALANGYADVQIILHKPGVAGSEPFYINGYNEQGYSVAYYCCGSESAGPNGQICTTNPAP